LLFAGGKCQNWKQVWGYVVNRLIIFAGLVFIQSSDLSAQSRLPPTGSMAKRTVEQQVIQEIEGGVATKLKLGKVEGKCDKVPLQPKDGDTAACTATTKAGKVARFNVTLIVKEAGRVDLAITPTNLIDENGLRNLMTRALPEIASQAKAKVDAKDVDCGSYFIYDNAADMHIPCVLTTASNKKKLEVDLHVINKSLNVIVKGIE
jgi:hypothetical protein